MARENQGLQIALIMFVITTIIFGVTTFLFFRNYDEAKRGALEANKVASRNKTTADNILQECNQLKELIGFQPSDKMDVVTEQANEEIDQYGADLAKDDERNYRTVVKNLQMVIDRKNAALAKALDDVKTNETVIASLEEQHKARHEAAQQGQQAAQDQARAIEIALTAEKQALEKTKTDMQGQHEGTLADAAKKIDTSSKQLRETKEDLDETRRRLKERIDQYRESQDKGVPEVPDGEIRSVNARTQIVWINLGHADALRPQQRFSVYSADASDVAGAEAKGSVEVTKVVGDHLSEARIVEEIPADPILPNDLVYTPVWAPGQREHFALTAGLDIDGDGRADMDKVRNLIAMNGGVIDQYMDENGDRSGKMTTKTRYLVYGSEKLSENLVQRRSDMISEARKLGVEEIELRTLLKRMGWKNELPGPVGSASQSSRPPREVPGGRGNSAF